MTVRSAEVAPTLRDAWGTWIAQQPWDCFLTLTSEKPTHPEAMLKRASYCARKVSDFVYGSHWERRSTGVQWMVGIERHKSGNPHAHALWRLPLVDIRGPAGKAIFDLAYWKQWIDATGGFSRLELPRSQQHVVGYVSKYVVKDGELYWSPNCEFPNPSGLQQLLGAASGSVAAAAVGGPATVRKLLQHPGTASDG